MRYFSPSFPFSASNLSLFRFAKIRSVFFCSIADICSQFVMRDSVPSTLTTIGPSASKRAEPEPDDTSIFVAESASGSAKVGFFSCVCSELVGCCWSDEADIVDGVDEVNLWNDVVPFRFLLSLAVLNWILGVIESRERISYFAIVVAGVYQ